MSRWRSCQREGNPRAKGVYLVLRLKNRYPTSRRFDWDKWDTGWESSDVVLFWRPLPKEPDDFSYPNDVIQEREGE